MIALAALLVCFAVWKLVELLRVHLLHLSLDPSAVATVVWVVAWMPFAAVLLHERSQFTLEMMLALAHGGSSATDR